MSLKSLAVAAALAAPCVAWAQAGEPTPKTSIGFARAADTFWSGSVSIGPCTPSRLQRVLFRRFTPRSLVAAQERHGELVGEILASPAALDVRTTAHHCAASAGDAVGAPVLLAGGRPGWSRFQAAFSACLIAEHADGYVGGMTLWIDSRCNW